MTELLHGLDPIVGASPRVLILGNMPSVMSLNSGQYYGNPRNAFWRITGSLFGFGADAPYPERVAALCTHRVAVWDVLRSCRRVGSLDSAVERDSMVPNDFEVFFTGHPTLERLVFNGAAAEPTIAGWSALLPCPGCGPRRPAPHRRCATRTSWRPGGRHWTVRPAGRRCPWLP